MISLKSVNKSYDMRFQRDDFSLKENLVTSFRRAHHSVKMRLGLTKSAFVDPFAPIEGYGSRGSQRMVLKNINLSIGAGETIALIGRNGCGKSTLLKLMAGIYQPDTGVVKIQGRVSPLIELGAGFHPEFSGRENVYLNGQILGLSRQDIKKRYDDIVSFAEIGDYINYPVRTYSSGMFMRLAFSVAVMADPDILLVDEIIAVGDAGFQAKCQSKMDEFKKRGKTIVLVTHSTHVVESWTHRAVYLRDGEIVCDDHPRKAVQQYLSDLKIGEQAMQETVSFPLAIRPLPETMSGLTFAYNEQSSAVECSGFSFDAAAGILSMNVDLRAICELYPANALRVRLLTQDRGLLLGENRQALPESTFRLELGGLEAVNDNSYVVELAALSAEKSEQVIACFGFSLNRGMDAAGLMQIPSRLLPVLGGVQ